MASNLKQLALVLQVAEELHVEGKLQNEDYKRLIENVEAEYKHSSNYMREVKVWLNELLSNDRASNQLQTLDTLLFTFLESSDADDHQNRTEIILLVKQFKKLLSITDGYNEKLLVRQLNHLQN
ncbi:hypothetical protein [Maribacter sp. Hel_I_7]|uniref:hypothetical protein n=1 Tax=Maribacter sp. Hel_I_7 TaxID=1249997 RepID=UPI00047ECD49|nr:hypothetical protein [Maribacter sp. Hel_I_7]